MTSLETAPVALPVPSTVAIPTVPAGPDLPPFAFVKFVRSPSAVSRFLLQPWSGLAVPPAYLVAAAVARRAGWAVVPASPVRRVLAELAVAAFWAGGFAVISFGEAWVKFHAPTVERRQALDVGRHVFSMLNKFEVLLSLLSVHLLLNRPHFTLKQPVAAVAAAGTTTLWAAVQAYVVEARVDLVAALPPAIVAAQSVFLLPTLLELAKDRVEGAPVSTAEIQGARAHALYGVLELVKFGALLTTVRQLGEMLAGVGDAALATGRVGVEGARTLVDIAGP